MTVPASKLWAITERGQQTVKEVATRDWCGRFHQRMLEADAGLRMICGRIAIDSGGRPRDLAEVHYQTQIMFAGPFAMAPSVTARVHLGRRSLLREEGYEVAAHLVSQTGFLLRVISRSSRRVLPLSATWFAVGAPEAMAASQV